MRIITRRPHKHKFSPLSTLSSKVSPKPTTTCDLTPSHRLYNRTCFLSILPRVIESLSTRQYYQTKTSRKPATVAIHTNNPLWFSIIWQRPFTFPNATTPASAHLTFSRILSSSQIWHQLLSINNLFAFSVCQKTCFCVYEKIDCSTRHVLDRSQGLPKGDYYWPIPPEGQACDSRITLIRPYNGFAIDVMATCHLVHQEVCQALKRKFEHCRSQAVRYLVDYSSAAAMIRYESYLGSCLGLAGRDFDRDENEALKNFLRTCATTLSQMYPTQSGAQEGSECLRSIEMTINHRSGIACKREVIRTMAWLGEIRDHTNSTCGYLQVAASNNGS